MKLLNIEDSLLIIIDIQERLVEAVKDTTIRDKASKLTEAAKILDIPVIISEQYPKGLGETIPEITKNLPKRTTIIEKTAFSLLKEPRFLEELQNYRNKRIILCGIEAHICVYQTAIDLLNEGFDVTIIKDICASRNDYEYNTGIKTLENNNAHISCLEMVLFEWLGHSKHLNFKEIQSLIK